MSRLACLLCVGLVLLARSPAARGEEFRPLFNGRDLAGWTNVNTAPSTWTVRDGVIVCTGVPTGVLRTEQMYENFVLELEWRHMRPGGNAGLFVHSDAITSRGVPFTRSIEVQILDGNHGDVFAIHGATLVPDRPHPKGSMRSLPSEKRARPAGEWNHYRVECRDGEIRLAVNGRTVSGATECNPRKGFICLESEGSEVHFRNIQIQELPSSSPPPEEVATGDRGFRSLYSGVDLSGWQVGEHERRAWRPDDWILRYRNESGPGDTLWTERAYQDLELVLDWRLPEVSEPRAESDRRASGRRATAAPSAGSAENAPAVLLRGPDGGRVELLAEGSRVEPGEWNRSIVTLRGDRASVQLNGERIIQDAELPSLPATGPIGLRFVGERAEFANLYVRPLSEEGESARR